MPPARAADALPGKNRIAAIVVTYRPGAEVPANLAALLRQVARVFVVDNEASPASRACLAPYAGNPAVEILENAENLGIATALNQGVARALAGDFDWIATFDQDSRVPEGYFAALLAAQAAGAERDRVAVVAPVYRDRHLGFLYSPGGPLGEHPAGAVPVRVTATSGNLVAPAAVRAVGAFRDDLFMSGVDFDFCLRCRRAGWLILEVRGVVLDHAMGRFQQRRWLGRDVRFNDYDAVRRYYQARNNLILYARHGGFDPRWAARDAWFYGRDLLKLLLFCEHRPEKIAAVLTGGWHALTGRRGKWQRASVTTES